MRVRSFASVLTATAALSCVAYEPPAAPPQPPAQTYALGVELRSAEYIPGLPDRSEALSADAKTVLRRGTRVGILPPDNCLTTKAGVSGDQSDLIRMNCGVLMSSLEVRLAQAGYQVVSWQALKPGDGKSGIDRARTQGVEVLFEIDQFTSGKIERDSELSVKLSYFMLRNGQLQPIEVTPQVREQCREVARAAAQQAKASMGGLGFEGVLSAKAVQVESGRAVWYYQKSIADLDDSQGRRHAELLYDAPGTAVPAPAEHPPGALSGTAVAGGTLMGIGLPVVGVGIALGESEDSEVRGVGTKVMTIGAVAAAGGILMLVLGNRSMSQANSRASTATGAVTYQPMEAVLCRAPARVAAPAAAPAQPQPGSASSDEYVERTSRPRNTEADRRNKITERIADDFSQALRVLVGG